MRSVRVCLPEPWRHNVALADFGNIFRINATREKSREAGTHCCLEDAALGGELNLAVRVSRDAQQPPQRRQLLSL